MRGLELLIEQWEKPNDIKDAFGPERYTWGKLRVLLNGRPISAHHSAETYSHANDIHTVSGGMSGIVEWIVECWTYLLWELQSPFPKSTVITEMSDVHLGVPGLREGMSLWADYLTYSDLNTIASWQHRHTLGHGCSDIALPSVVFLPELKHVGIIVDHPPTQLLNAPVRFTPPENTTWPSEPVWVAKEDIIDTLSTFVTRTITRAKEHKESIEWAQWIENEWKQKRNSLKDPQEKIGLMFGEAIKKRWKGLKELLQEKIEAFQGILLDSPGFSKEEEIEEVSVLVKDVQLPDGCQDCWLAKHHEIPMSGIGAVWDQGYEAASFIRKSLSLGDEPILDLRDFLRKIGIETRSVKAKDRFRSLVVAFPDGRATICFADDMTKYSGVAPIRFGMAAALGRLVCEFGSQPGGTYGAAHGPHARYRETQRANAFAAELLLPKAAVQSGNSIDCLCDEYGISHSAAHWHINNRQQNHVKSNVSF